MRDELLARYEHELGFLRRTGAEFARRYPKVASRLLLEPNKCDDPHVERLLEGFALLAARIQLRIDDDFPEFSDALLQLLYPHHTRPIPSMALVEFQLDPEQGKLTRGLRIPRGAPVNTRPVGGAPLRFRTVYDTTLWPVSVASARWISPRQLNPPVGDTDVVAALRVELQCFRDITFAKLEMDTLRLHLAAESNLASTLYELLCNNCVQVLVRDPSGTVPDPIVLPPSALTPVGFGEQEGMLPASSRAFLGYNLLQEYFTFPEKFFFLDLAGFDRVRAAGFGASAEVVFLISAFQRPERRTMLETAVSADVIRLGCTPIVNLFDQTSEPILLDQRRTEYLLVPDARRREAVNVFSVDEVIGITPGAPEPLRFQPLYSFKHANGNGDGHSRAFWYASRRPSGWRRDEETDVYLTFADLTGRVVHPDLDAVTARLTCHNGSLPGRLAFGDPNGDFDVPGGGPLRRILTRTNPTAVAHPALGRPELWRLVSQLSLSFTSLVDAGPEGLQELLRLHNVGDSAAGEKQIQGIVGVKCAPAHSMIPSVHGLTFARGQRVELEFDEERFAGGGVYLLASVLERFLGLFVSMNSFCTLAARTRQRPEPLREWPPRAGWKALL